MRRNKFVLIAIFLCLLSTFGFGQSQGSKTQKRFTPKNAPPIVHSTMSQQARKNLFLNTPAASQLPLFNYQLVSSRDGFLYQGVIVGANPNQTGSAAQVNVT